MTVIITELVDVIDDPNPPAEKPEDRGAKRTCGWLAKLAIRPQIEVVPVDTIAHRLDVDGFFVQRVLVVLLRDARDQNDQQ